MVLDSNSVSDNYIITVSYILESDEEGLCYYEFFPLIHAEIV